MREIMFLVYLDVYLPNRLSTHNKKHLSTQRSSLYFNNQEMASLIAILDLKGKSLIQRSYKDDIPASAVDKFMPIVLEMEEDLQTVTPCFSKDGINYMHIKYSNLYSEWTVISSMYHA